VTAEYEIIRVNLTNFMVGRFPRDELWRPWAAAGLTATMLGMAVGAATESAAARAAEAQILYHRATSREWLHRFWPLLLLVVVLLSFTRTFVPSLLTAATLSAGLAGYWLGRVFPVGLRRWVWVMLVALLLSAYLALAGFDGVGWDDWGGLHLTIFVTLAGILFAFPFGLLLALGRRSSLPTLRYLSVTYIEVLRGVPLITLLFMGIFALGFLLPPGIRPGPVTRVIVAITLFEAAYIAEIVRGGLQGVPAGQVEAAQALGLSAWQTIRQVVLPQALRNTIPAMVGQFISLYKDTSLVTIVGLTDVLRVSNQANSQPEFFGQGLDIVTLPFVGLIYWVGSFTMSREARRLEKRLGVGER
jgi:general L-amino acid transport system permease protein